MFFNRISSSFSSISASSSNSLSNIHNGPDNTFRLDSFDSGWKTHDTHIISVQLLARVQGSMNIGAYHTALLFETNEEYVVSEYGVNVGIIIKYYPKKLVKNIEAYRNIMGHANKVLVYDLTSCFNNIADLRLNHVYKILDGEFRYTFKPCNYNTIKHNCRDFVYELCKKIDCNPIGLDFIANYFVTHMNYSNAFVYPLYALTRSNLYDTRFLIGHWDLHKKVFIGKHPYTF